MAKITLDELSNSLKDHLDTLGLTEEQVNSLVQNKLGDLSNLETVHKDNIVDSVNEVKDMAAFIATAVFGSDMSNDTLMTDNNSVIGAINELFQNVDSGKQLIADAIDDESITKDSTFEAMSEAIKEGSVDTGKWIELLAIAGYSVSETDTMDDIYSKLQTTCKAVYDVEKVFCGYRTTFILKKDGTLWGCGQNDKGQLGLGTTSSTQKSFVQVTENVSDVKHIECGKETGFTYMLKNDGTLWSTGLNSHGQLGLGDSTNRNVFTQVTTDVEQVACGDYHAMILKTDGTIWTCGYNNLGQLGAGNSDSSMAKSFVKRSFNTTSIKKIDCGAAHSFVLTNDGELWVCGYNENGQLGLDHNTSMPSFTKATVNVNNIADISCGCYNSLILKTDGTVWGCGNNANTPLSGISASNYCGSFTQLTGATNVMIAKVSLAYTMIVKNDGTVWACGVNTNGQLGTGNTTKQTEFIQVAKKITNVNQIACGDSHTCILCDDEYGKLYVTGLNDNGQLGLDSTSQKTSFTINTGFIL